MKNELRNIQPRQNLLRLKAVSVIKKWYFLTTKLTWLTIIIWWCLLICSKYFNSWKSPNVVRSSNRLMLIHIHCSYFDHSFQCSCCLFPCWCQVPTMTTPTLMKQEFLLARFFTWKQSKRWKLFNQLTWTFKK